jgi:PmbA protein
MDGKSRWEKSLGEKVAADLFTLTDNPFNLDLMGATPFDGEGVSVKVWPVIERGVLKTHLDSTYTAKRRGTTSTGHAGGLHGIEVAPGESSKAELLKSAERLVVVERFSGNVDRDTGDFSGVAKSSHYYKRGEYQHPLTETMIAGNVFELLKNITALSDRAEPYCNAYQAPWVLADGVSVTAG